MRRAFIKDIAGIKLIRIEFVGKVARQPDLPHAGAEVFEAVMDDCLTDRQKQIIRAHYGFDGPACTDRAFAEKAGLSTGLMNS